MDGRFALHGLHSLSDVSAGGVGGGGKLSMSVAENGIADFVRSRILEVLVDGTFESFEDGSDGGV